MQQFCVRELWINFAWLSKPANLPKRTIAVLPLLLLMLLMSWLSFRNGQSTRVDMLFLAMADVTGSTQKLK